MDEKRSRKKKKMKTLKELLRSKVGRKQPVVFAFGRLNPPTIGHQKLIDKVITMAKRVKGLPVLYVSASQDKNKNPLTAKQKLDYLKKIYPRGIQLMPATGNERTFMEILKNRFDKRYTDVYMVAGSDRVLEFKKLIKKYNGKDYNFDTVNVVSAGERDPDAEGVTGMSASKMRALAKQNNYKDFRSGLMKNTKEKDAMKLFKDLKNQMGVREDMVPPSSDSDELRVIRENYHNGEIFNMNETVENLKDGSIGKIIKRGPNYVQYEMEDGGVKRAWLDDIVPAETIDEEVINENVDQKKLVLQKNSDRLVSFKTFDEEINAASNQQDVNTDDEDKARTDNEKKDKKSKQKVKTPGQPETYDSYVDTHISDDQKSNTRKFSQVTPGQERDYEKLVADRALAKFEGVDRVAQDPDIKKKSGTQPKKYYSGLKKSTKSARDAHFKKGAKMDDDNPAAYKPAPGDSKGKTRPSKHTQKFKKMFGEVDEDLSANDIRDWALLPETIEMFKDIYQTDWKIELDNTVAEMLEDISIDETATAAIKKKAEKSGMPAGILRKVYNRGVAAWRTGHRPGTTPQQWGLARVNSFVTKSSGTWGKADKDLAARVRGK
jgi:nicotinic acid mononucleotide adenylyltransferase